MTPPTPRSTVDVVAGLLVRDGCVLVAQRSPTGSHPGKWEFPGGKIEPGEAPRQALRRELQEELGIQARIGPILWSARFDNRGRARLRLRFFHVTSYRGDVRNRVFAALEWRAPAELPPLDWLDADRELVRRIVAGELRLVESRHSLPRQDSPA